MKRCFLVVIDSLGVGEAPDADEYGDDSEQENFEDEYDENNYEMEASDGEKTQVFSGFADSLGVQFICFGGEEAS